MANSPDPTLLCERCGYAQSLHKLANLADGIVVGEYLLICPTALFSASPRDTSAAEDFAKRQVRRERESEEPF